MSAHTAHASPHVAPGDIPPTAAGRPAPADGQLGIVELLSDLRDEGTTLLRKEGELARAEISRSLERVTTNLGKIVFAGVLAIAGTVILLIAAAAGVGELLEALGTDPDVAEWLGPLLLGLLVTGLAGGLLYSAINGLKHVDPVPERTVETLQENSAWMKDKVTS